MLLVSFFAWWYGEGWTGVWHRTIEQLHIVGRGFSVKLLLRTLFSPWRRIMTPRGRGLDAHIHAAIDNGVGRFIGFTVRLIVLITAAFAMAAVGIGGLILLLLWPLMPPAVVSLLILGIFV